MKTLKHKVLGFSAGLKMGIWVAVAALSLGLVAPATPTVASSQLQADADAIHAAGTVGVLGEVVINGQSTKVRAGTAIHGISLPVPLEAHFRTGSNTKTIVAAAILQLVGEGKLSLEDKVDTWLPGVIQGNGNDGTKITVRQLLQHTSGLFDYTTDEGFISTLLTKKAFNQDRFRHYEPQELINIALSHPPTFEPGASWSYSNTGYIVAGEIIKAVTGNEWHEEVKKRILIPHGLTETKSPGDNPFIPWPNMRGYHIFTSDPLNREYTDTTWHNMSWGGAAGDLITTTRDENRFLSRLLSGKVLKPAQLAEMKKTVELAPGVGYGLGLLHQTVGTTCGIEFWGHTGGVVGYISYVLGTTDGKHTLVLANSTTTFSEEQYANDSAIAQGQFLDHALCPEGTTSPSPTTPQRIAAPASTLPGVQWANNPLK